MCNFVADNKIIRKVNKISNPDRYEFINLHKACSALRLAKNMRYRVNSQLHTAKRQKSTSCRARIAGIPHTKYQCRVLCRKICIPRTAPALPPAKAAANNAFSGMRQRPLRARRLSAPIITNDAALIAAK